MKLKANPIECNTIFGKMYIEGSQKLEEEKQNNCLTGIYEEYNRYIYHLCLKLTRNIAEAEDLMQEVWVKVVRNEEQVEKVDHVKAWLTTITMNTFRDRYRKNVRRSKYMMSQPETLDVPILDLVPNNEISTEDQVEKRSRNKNCTRKNAAIRRYLSKNFMVFLCGPIFIG